MATKIGSLFGEVVLDTRKMERSLKRAQRKLTRFGRQATGVGRSMATGFGAPLVAATTVAVKQFSDLEQGMLEVKTLMPDIANEDFSKLNKGIKDLSLRFGNDLNANVGALYQAISAGVPQDNVLSFLEVASKGAIAGVTDTATAVDGLTTVLNAFRMNSDEAREVSDKMFTAVRLGKTNFEQLSKFMFQGAKISDTMGVSFDELLGSVTALTLQGTPTSVAFTQIKAALSSLTKPTKEMSKAFAVLNVETAQELISERGFVGALQALTHEAGLSSEELGKAFGSVEGYQAVLALTGDSLSKTNEVLKEISDSAGATDKAYSEMSQSIAMSFGRLKNALQVTLINFVEAGGKDSPLRNFIDNITTLINKNQTAIMQFLELAMRIAVFGTLTGVAVTVVGQLAFALVNVANAVKLASVGFMKFAKPVAAIVAIGFIVKEVYEEVSGKALTWKDVTINVLATLITAFELASGMIQQAMDKIKTAIVTVIDLAKKYIEQASKAEVGMAMMMGAGGSANLNAQLKAMEALAEVQVEVATETKEVTKSMGELERMQADNVKRATELYESFMGMRESFDLFGEKGVEATEDVSFEMKEMGKTVEKVVEDILGETEKAVKTTVEKIKDSFNIIGNEFKAFVSQDMFDFNMQVASGISDLSENMTDGFVKFFEEGKAGLNDFVDNFLKQMQRMVIQSQIVNPLLEAGMGFVGGLFGTGKAPAIEGKARGGSVTANTPYIVGERGMELFVPNTSGKIVPNNALGGNPVVVNFHVDAVDAQSFDSMMMQRENMIVGMIDQAFHRRGRAGING